MRRTLVAGNWKMNGSKDSISALLNGIKQGLAAVNSHTDVAVFAPAIYLPLVSEQLQGTPVKWGAQTLSKENAGAFTGEISASMLLDFACEYVLVGHSERRSLYGETDQDVADKFSAARAAGLKPVLCVGESLAERENGDTESVVARQLDAVIAKEGIEALKDGVIAYEPVWAIGTGKTASPEQAQAVHAFIRARLAAQNSDVAAQVQVLYGGSMNAANAAELIAQTDIDGGLIGGASLKADDFLTICKA
jgi:triosephosphate isomerase